MSDKTKLFVICGFDRTGKDTLLSSLQTKFQGSTEDYVYIQHHEDKPSYRDDPDAFTAWMRGYIRKQVDELKDIASRGYKRIYMTRFILSDEVYCKIFNRKEHVVSKFMDEMLESFEIENRVFLFTDYNEYLARLKQIDDNYVEYSEEEFNKVNDYYDQVAYQLAARYKIRTNLRLVDHLTRLEDIFNVQAKPTKASRRN